MTDDKELIARLLYLSRVTRDYDQEDMTSADYAGMPVATKEAAARIEALTAKLAKAVEALNAAVGYYDKVNPFRQADYHNESCDCDRCRFDRARATWGEPSDYDPIGLKAILAEIKGESQDGMV